jgi:hypothetical protein
MTDYPTEDTNVLETSPEAEAENEAPAEQIEDASSVSDDTADSAEDKKPGRAAERIQQLVGEKKAAMEYGDFWKQKFEEVAQVPAPASEPEKPETPSVMPRLEDFEYDNDAWAVAYSEWANRNAARTAEEAAKRVIEQNQKTVQTDQLETAWQNRVADFANSDSAPDDFIAVLSSPEFVQTPEMAETIKTDANGPELAYYLGTNIAEASRIAQLPPVQQGIQLGRILDKFSSQKSAVAQKQTTAAPTPPNPVGSGQPANTPGAEESIEDFMRRRNREDMERRRAESR